MRVRLTERGGEAVDVDIPVLDEPPPILAWGRKVFDLWGRRGDLWQYVERRLPESMC